MSCLYSKHCSCDVARITQVREIASASAGEEECQASKWRGCRGPRKAKRGACSEHMSWKAALKPYQLKLNFSNKFSYAQILRSEDGHILAAASTIEKDLRESLPKTSNKEVNLVP